MLLNSALWEVWNVRSETARNCSGFMSFRLQLKEWHVEVSTKQRKGWFRFEWQQHLRCTSCSMKRLSFLLSTKQCCLLFLILKRVIFLYRRLKFRQKNEWELVFSPSGCNSASINVSLGVNKFKRWRARFCEGHCAAQAPHDWTPEYSRLGLMWLNKRGRNWVQKRIVRDLRGSRAVQLRMRQLITTWTWWLDFDSKLSWGE